MAGCQNKKIKKIFPPLLRKNPVFSIKHTNNKYTQQGCEKWRVKKASMTKKIIIGYVQPAVTDNVDIRQRGTGDAQKPEFQGFFSRAKAVRGGTGNYRMRDESRQCSFRSIISILPALNVPFIIVQLHIVNNEAVILPAGHINFHFRFVAGNGHFGFSQCDRWILFKS